MLTYSETYHLKKTDSFTNENTPTPILYQAYDPDAEGRTVGVGNIHRLPNMHWRFLKPFTAVRLSLHPTWEFAPNKYGAVMTSVHKVDRPWFDSALLTNNSTQAPSIKSLNGRLVVLEHCINRILIKHISGVMLFRGRRNGQRYE